MRQITTYGVRIRAESFKPIQNTVLIYRNAVNYKFPCRGHWYRQELWYKNVKNKYGKVTKQYYCRTVKLK